jgi:hypothetical protein
LAASELLVLPKYRGVPEYRLGRTANPVIRCRTVLQLFSFYLMRSRLQLIVRTDAKPEEVHR